MRRWVAAVRAHQPGVRDQALLDVAGESQENLNIVRREIGRVLAADFRTVAQRNDVVRRGALLHTDLVILAPERAAAFDTLTDAPSQPGAQPTVRVRIGQDGEYLGSAADTAHWAFARALLDRISPDPRDDEFVLRWYRAVAALLQAATLLGSATGHMEAAQKLFPHDPLVLFYAGAMQEALASTVFQNILHARPDVVVRGRPKFETPRSTYLRSAERFLRESVEQGGPVEARVRLGRVLGELGRHADAAATLRDVLPHVDDPVLRYFAELFLGSEEEALGRRDEARACFERAAALVRGAQSPLLALSALEWRAGRPAAALVALNRLQALHASVDRDDPWWSYFRSYAFDANQQLASVRASLQLKRVE